jgi:hypothetical protein
MSKRSCPAGKDMFSSQLKTVSLLQPSVPQVPLFLQPLTFPSLLVEHDAHDIIRK